MSSEESAVAEETEAGSAVRLSHDALRFGVHALGGAVAAGKSEGCDDGLEVLLKPSD
jgi:hypothetical protein